MTTYSKLRLDNGSVLEKRSNVGAQPKFFLNGQPIDESQYLLLKVSENRQAPDEYHHVIKDAYGNDYLNVISSGQHFKILLCDTQQSVTIDKNLLPELINKLKLVEPW